MRPVLVTGSTGCLGGHVTRHLIDRGHRVRALVLPAQLDQIDALLPGQVEVVAGDVLESDSLAEAVEGCSAVVHLAGVAGVAVADPGLMMAVNHTGTRNVARSCLDHGVRLVHISSASAVGVVDGRLLNEEFAGDDGVTHPYPVSKRAGEQAVRQLMAQGLDALTLAPAAVLAPGGDPANTWSGLPLALAAGRLPLAPPGGFGFVSAATLVAAVRAALEHAPSGTRSGTRYLLVDANLSYLELFRMVAAELGVRPPRGVVPRGVLACALRLGDRLSALPGLGRRVPLRADALPLLCHRVRFDGRLAHAELGIAARPVSEAVRDLVHGLPSDRFRHHVTPTGESR